MSFDWSQISFEKVGHEWEAYTIRNGERIQLKPSDELYISWWREAKKMYLQGEVANSVARVATKHGETIKRSDHMVLAKFRVTQKTEVEQYDSQNPNTPTIVKFIAVQGEPFGKFTPCGEIEMTIVNDEAANQFKVGKEYFVEFRPAE